MTLVVGVDGWRKGWIAIAVENDRFLRALARPALIDILQTFDTASTVAVDVPIGLPANGRRRADIDARSFVDARRNSVFWTPPRDALLAPSHADAVAVCARLNTPGVSQQAYALRHRILEAELLAASDSRVAEIHPEVSFAALARVTLSAKRTWNGQMQRRAALQSSGLRMPEDLEDAGEVPSDDVLDAAAAAWSALRIAGGEAKTLPADPVPHEPRIWY